MKTKNAKEAKKHWDDLCKSVAKKSSPFAGMSKEQAIEAMRKVREKLWEAKLAARP